MSFSDPEAQIQVPGARVLPSDEIQDLGVCDFDPSSKRDPVQDSDPPRLAAAQTSDDWTSPSVGMEGWFKEGARRDNGTDQDEVSHLELEDEDLFAACRSFLGKPEFPESTPLQPELRQHSAYKGEDRRFHQIPCEESVTGDLGPIDLFRTGELTPCTSHIDFPAKGLTKGGGPMAESSIPFALDANGELAHPPIAVGAGAPVALQPTAMTSSRTRILHPVDCGTSANGSPAVDLLSQMSNRLQFNPASSSGAARVRRSWQHHRKVGAHARQQHEEIEGGHHRQRQTRVAVEEVVDPWGAHLPPVVVKGAKAGAQEEFLLQRRRPMAVVGKRRHREDVEFEHTLEQYSQALQARQRQQQQLEALLSVPPHILREFRKDPAPEPNVASGSHCAGPPMRRQGHLPVPTAPPPIQAWSSQALCHPHSLYTASKGQSVAAVQGAAPEQGGQNLQFPGPNLGASPPPSVYGEQEIDWVDRILRFAKAPRHGWVEPPPAPYPVPRMKVEIGELRGTLPSLVPLPLAHSPCPSPLGPSMHLMIRALEELAQMASVGDNRSAQSLLDHLAPALSPWGDASQRLGYYFVNALLELMRGSGGCGIEFTPVASQPPANCLPVEHPFVSHLPYFIFCHEARNCAIAEEINGSESVHVIDLGLWQTDQWASLFRRIAANNQRIQEKKRSTAPGSAVATVSSFVEQGAEQGSVRRLLQAQKEQPLRRLRVTSVSVPPVTRARRTMEEDGETVKQDLLQAAIDCGLMGGGEEAEVGGSAAAVPFMLQFRRIDSSLDALTWPVLQMLARSSEGQEGEKLIVSSFMQMQNVGDEAFASAPDRTSPRDELLQAFRGLAPSLFIIADAHADYCTTDFASLCHNSLVHFASMFDALDAPLEDLYIGSIDSAAGLPLDDPEGRGSTRANLARQNFEKVASKQMLHSLCSLLPYFHCERSDQWARRLERAGFRPVPFRNSQVLGELREAVSPRRGFPRGFGVAGLHEEGTVLLTWKGQPQEFVTAWTAREAG